MGEGVGGGVGGGVFVVYVRRLVVGLVLCVHR